MRSREGYGEAEQIRRNPGGHCVVETKKEFSKKKEMVCRVNAVKAWSIFSTPFGKPLQRGVRARVGKSEGGYLTRDLRATRCSECK